MTTAQTFAHRLNTLRKEQHLTVQQLANEAGVHQSLISGLQTGNRSIGEYNARRIGNALQLDGEALESFVYLAINNCSERVLSHYKEYPAEVLNLIANTLQMAGISAESITRCIRNPQLEGASPDAALYLNDGRAALINVDVALR